jgi:hypothetical protein
MAAPGLGTPRTWRKATGMPEPLLRRPLGLAGNLCAPDPKPSTVLSVV